MEELNRLSNVLNFAGLTESEYKDCERNIREENRKHIRFISIFMVVIWALMLFWSIFTKASIGLSVFYFVSLILSILINIITVKDEFSTKISVLVSVYIFMGIFLGFGIVSSSSMTDKISIIYVVLLLLVPVLFCEKPYRVNFFLVVFTVIYLVTVHSTKDSAIKSVDLIVTIGCFVLSCIVNTLLMIRKAKRIYALPRIEEKTGNHKTNKEPKKIKNRTATKTKYKNKKR